MKVLHVIDKLNIGGAEKICVTLTGLLAGAGVQVGILMFNTGGALQNELDKRLTVHVLNRNNKFSPAALYKAHRVCSHYDVVHTHLRHVYAYIRLAQVLFGGRYKIITHDHSAVPQQTPWRFSGLFKPRYYIGVNAEQLVWAKSLGVKNTFLLENRISPPHDVNVFRGTSHRVIIVANIRRVKNISFAIEYCKKNNLPLDIYGNVTEQDYYQELLRFAGNDERIKFKAGVYNLFDVYSEYALAIMPSPKETGPLVLLEYLAAGLPFVAYKTGNIAEAIAAHLPQLFLSNYDMAAWTERINEIMADEQLPVKMRALFREQFSPVEYLNKCLEVYQSVHS